MPLDKRGFSLIELMITVAIVSFSFTLSLDQIFALNRLHKKIDAQNHTRMDAKLISDYLAKNLRQIGGGNVRPWMGMWLENNCVARDNLPNCNGADRLTYAHLNRDFTACQITNAEAPNRLHFDPAMAQCCMPAINSQQLVLNNGVFYSSFFVTNSNYDLATSRCYVDITPGQLYGLNAANSPPAFADWAGGTMTAVRTATVYIDPTLNELRSYVDTNNNRQIDTDEELLLADQIVDLQFLLGFDGSPQDGSIDNRNSDQDEWLFNATSVNELLGSGGLATASLTDLRMLALGVITEAKHYGNTSEVRLFDGPLRTVTNSQLTAGQSRIYLRSTFIYNN